MSDTEHGVHASDRAREHVADHGPGHASEHVPDNLSDERAAFEERRRLRQERRQRRLVMTGVVALLAVILVALTAWFTYQKGMRGLSSTRRLTPDGALIATDDEDAVGVAGISNNGRVNVLVVGTDEGPDSIGRTDTMMLVSYDPRTGDAGVLSIPRDTRVQIPGRSGYHRVNVAQVLGGPQLAMRTVEQLLGVAIDHYVVVSFAGFERVIDLLGGVTMLVERPMRYDDFAQRLHIDLKPGLQQLNGEQALHYVRFRGDRLGDVSLVDPTRELYDGRVKRQLDFVQAVAKEALSWKTLPKLPQLAPQVFSMVQTNISYDRALALVVSLRNFESTRLDVAVLPGTSDIVGGASYWVHDPVRTRLVVDRVIRGERVVKLEVLNGNGGTGVAARAADMLRRSGFDVVRIGNAPDSFAYDETQIIVRAGQAGDDAEEAAVYTAQLQRLIGGRVVTDERAMSLGVGGAGVAVSARDAAEDGGNGGTGQRLSAAGSGDTAQRTGAGADATIIIGRDFRG